MDPPPFTITEQEGKMAVYSVNFSQAAMEILAERVPEAASARTGERSGIISEALERYFYMLARASAGLRGILSREEVSLVADACNGTLWQSWSVPHLAAEIQDAVRLDALDEKWGVDGPSLIAKLQALDIASIYALVDAVERYWSRVEQGCQPVIGDLLL